MAHKTVNCNSHSFAHGFLSNALFVDLEGSDLCQLSIAAILSISLSPRASYSLIHILSEPTLGLISPFLLFYIS